MGCYAAHLMNPMTLPKEDQAMIHLKTKKECIVSRDETKVMIAHDHTQYIAIWQEDWMMKTPGMN